MSNATELKQQIFGFLDPMDESALVTEAEKDQLKSWCDDLCQHTAVPEPINDLPAAAGVWRSRFASFGAKHSDNQPMMHLTDLKLQSFGNLPSAPARVTELMQEIDVDNRAYNNVVHVTNQAGDTNAVVVMFGRYDGADDNLQRYGVSFYRVALINNSQHDDDKFRAAFGIDADAPLDVEFRPPALHSDIVYLDEDTRVNYGKLGGFYVLSRDSRAAYSLDL
ncbi:MAG: hypothetical protein AB8B96_02080 [Lysobacterales bacterium]